MKQPIYEKRIKNFEDMAYGMFIHWGLYSLLGQGEWVQNFKKIPTDEYNKLKDKFDAKDFRPSDLVALAKEAGMKYITLTTRHHEGFSLYDTKGLSDWDALHSPAGRDLVREFIEACNQGGIVPFLYHTTLDWSHPDFENDFAAYLDYLQKSVEILCKEYGEIGGFWFDGNWSKPDADWKLDALYGMIRTYQPNALIINNTGLNARGELGHPEIDSVTFEQGLPKPIDRSGMPKYISAEMCSTLNDHWGCGSKDFNYKSTAEIIKTLCRCRKAGANLLLNIGLEASGSVDPFMAHTLKKVGEWVAIFKEALYKTRPCEVAGSGENFALQSPEGHYYLFIFDLPIEGDSNVVLHSSGGILPQVFTGIKREVKSISWLDSYQEESLQFMQDVQTGVLTVNATPQKYGDSLVVRVAKVIGK